MKHERVVRVIVQARLESARLPAKALLPLGGIPSAVLCARRAANTGLHVMAALAEGRGDRELARAFEAGGIPCMLGSPHDVLGRFAAATSDMPADGAVVRLTGDNVIPDGAFLQALLAEFERRADDYVGTCSPDDGLPYGLSAEVFTVRALREADRTASCSFDREHVTPAMRRGFAASSWFGVRELGLPDLSHLRCTLDNAQDYLRLCELFSDVADPVRISWPELLDRLAHLPGAPRWRIPFRRMHGRAHGEMALGTAQLGMAYGVANVAGKPSRAEAIHIVREAIARGVTEIDTARAYGDAEGIVGEALVGVKPTSVRVITKLAPLDHIGSASSAAVRDAVEASVFRSCRELRCERIDVLLLHRWIHRRLNGGIVWDILLELRENGIIRDLGVSIADPAEAHEVFADPHVRHVQLPFNILDWRWREAGLQHVLAGQSALVHVRSALLQGILAAHPRHWPDLPGLQPREWTTTLDQLAQRLGRCNRADLCLAYVRAQPWFASVVVGVDTLPQLRETCKLFTLPPLSTAECVLVDDEVPRAPRALLNPALWRA